MEIAEYFKQLESEYRSATPWQWPRSMTDEELDVWRDAWPSCELTSGAYIGNEAVIRATYPGVVKVFTIDFGSMRFEAP